MKKSINNKKLFRKIVSFAFTLLIATLSLSFAFAVEPVVLTEANVLEWPTTTGEVYYGQKISEYITLSGGIVTTDGTAEGEVIPGHFEHTYPDATTTEVNDAHAACVKFVPDDTSLYTGFQVDYTSKVTFVAKQVTPVLVDDNNPPVASEVEAGSRLSKSTITGGQMKNPYNPEESKVLSKTWAWSNPREKVNESGYYTAKFAAGAGYEVLTMDIYVRIAGDTPLSEIVSNPIIDITYDPKITWDKVIFEGGKAVIKGTTTEIAGTFSISENWNNIIPIVGSYDVDVTFTPDDETVALPIEFKCPVTVNKAVPTFKTDDGSGIPTVTMPYGTKLDSSLDYKIKPLVDVNVPVYLAYKDMKGENLSYSGTAPAVGTHEIQVRVNIHDSNYETLTMLTFKLEITGFAANCIMEPVGNQGYKIHDTSIKYDGEKPRGTFTVSYTVDGVKQPDVTVKYEELFQVEKTKSGKYEFTVKYNEIENDPFEIADITYSAEEKLERNVKIGDSNKKYTYGDKVTAVAPATDPSMPDKPYYGFTGWEVTGNIGLSDEELENTEISFAMPDEDVELKATYKFSFKLFFEWIWQQIVKFFTFIINAFKDLFELAAAA